MRWGSLSCSWGQAYAECAWVLWEQHQSILVVKKSLSPLVRWDYLSAYATQAECSKVLEEKMNATILTRRTITGTKVEVGDNNCVLTNSFTPEGKWVMGENFRFICAPDTVDPRGPKGR